MIRYYRNSSLHLAIRIHHTKLLMKRILFRLHNAVNMISGEEIPPLRGWIS